MKLVSSFEMREIDRRTIEDYKIPAIILMERAGNAVFKTIKTKFGSPDNKIFWIFCGRGNNGGDGYVVARLLYKSNAKVKVFISAKKEEIRGDAKVNLDLLLQTPIEVLEITSESEFDNIKNLGESPDLIIDALLGTGTKGEITGIVKSIIEFINSLNMPVLSIDIPSGIDADTGRILGAGVKASYTVTMGLKKIGLAIHPGVDFSGEIIIADLGFPKELIESEELKTNLVTDSYIKDKIKPRNPDTHKGNYGKVLIIAGSPGFTGAAYLCSEGCIRAGAGLVTLAVPESLQDILSVKLTEVMTLSVPETEYRTFGIKAIQPILEFLKKCNAVAIGPGISTNRQTALFLKGLLRKISLPCVLDADALTILSTDISILQKCSAPIILTPHPGELSRLLGISSYEIQQNRIDIAKYSAKELNCIVVLKGAKTVIADRDGNIFVNPTGNPGMASGGVGDVLTGVIAALLSQGLTPLCAAICGVYIHGLAGDIAKRKVGEISLIASDILNNLGEAFMLIEQSYPKSELRRFNKEFKN